MSNKPTDTMKPGSYEEKLWNSFKENRRRTLFPAALHAEGATGSAVMFSLIQTALENGLDPYNYLTWLLKQAKDSDLTDTVTVKKLLPWNAVAECKTR